MNKDLKNSELKDRFGDRAIPAKFKPFEGTRRPLGLGRKAIWQSRLMLLVMINLAQLWVLSATVEAALAHQFKQLLPLVIGSGACWLIALTIYLWWKPIAKPNKPTK